MFSKRPRCDSNPIASIRRLNSNLSGSFEPEPRPPYMTCTRLRLAANRIGSPVADGHTSCVRWEKGLENPGIDPGTSHMLSERSTT